MLRWLWKLWCWGFDLSKKKKCNPRNAPSLSLLLCVNSAWCQPSKGQRGSIIQEFPVIRGWTWIMPRPGANSPWRRQRRWSLRVFQLADPTLIPHKAREVAENSGETPWTLLAARELGRKPQRCTRAETTDVSGALALAIVAFLSLSDLFFFLFFTMPKFYVLTEWFYITDQDKHCEIPFQ